MSMQLWQECLLTKKLEEAMRVIGSNAPRVVVEAAAHHVLNAYQTQPSAEEWGVVPEELSALAVKHGYVVHTYVQGSDFELLLIEKLTRVSPYVEILHGVSSGDPFAGVELPHGVELNTAGDLVQFMSDGLRLVPYITKNNIQDVQQIVKDLRLHGLID